MMRISTLTYLTASLSGIKAQQSAIGNLSQQLATGQRLQSPKDDPVAAARILQLTDQVAQNAQYQTNQNSAASRLNVESTVLSAAGDTLSSISSVVQNLQDTQDPNLQATYIQHLKSLLNDLLGYANYQDTGGNYIFAGSQTSTQPFQYDSGTKQYVYKGDAQQLAIQVGANTTVQASDPGGNASGSSYDPTNPSTPAPVFGNLNLSGNQFSQDNVFTMVNTLISNLTDNTLTAAQKQQALSDAASFVSQESQVFQQIQSRVGTTQNVVTDLQAGTTSLLNQYNGALSQLNSVDQASVAVQLQLRQTSLQAAAQAYSNTSQLSLFNYL